MTCNDLFIAAELLVGKEERAKEETNTKLALQLQDADIKALAVLQQEKSA